jgi:alkylation response protein AidB-like acyl-CoA dehydrogenase
MDFSLSEESLMMRDMFRKFAKNEVEPLAAELDKTHEFPMTTFKKMADLGLCGLPIPEEWGGAGASYLDFAIFVEELAKCCASTAVIMSVHTGLGCMSTYLYGSQRVKEKYLRALCTGEIIGAYALTEPNAGSDAASLKCRAEDKGDHFLVNGSKIFITNGGVATTYCTFVKTDPTQPSGRGITCLIIEKDTPGFTMSKPVEKMGMNGSPTVELYFEDVKVPKENVLDIARDKKIFDQIAQMEEKKGRDKLFEALAQIGSPSAYIAKMAYEQKPGDLVFITGVGKVYPFMRSHNILNNLFHVLDRIPVIMFFPGTYDGQALKLFNRFNDDNYYRAFQLIK